VPATPPARPRACLQVGGYATRYANANNFTFLTVRGGRHEVPETAPVKAFAMVSGLVSGSTFSDGPQ
jgi:serine carboxypeptidase-like clade 1